MGPLQANLRRSFFPREQIPARRGGGAEGAGPPWGRCPRGARLSLEKAGGKSTRGRSPLDPRSGEEVPPLRTPSLVFSGLEGGSSFQLTGLRPSQRQAPKESRPPIGRLAPIVRTLREQTWAYLLFRYFSSCHLDFFRFPHRDKKRVPQPPKWWAARLGAFR